MLCQAFLEHLGLSEANTSTVKLITVCISQLVIATFTINPVVALFYINCCIGLLFLKYNETVKLNGLASVTMWPANVQLNSASVNVI